MLKQPEERIFQQTTEPDEELNIRPSSLGEFIGQDQLKEKLNIYITAARQRGEALDHLLFYGPPGLGKTTLAGIIAHEMGGQLRVTTGPALERTGDLAAILSNLEENDVLFIDEIHRLPASVEEILYPAMEDFALDIVIGKGPGARSTGRSAVPRTGRGVTASAPRPAVTSTRWSRPTGRRPSRAAPPR